MDGAVTKTEFGYAKKDKEEEGTPVRVEESLFQWEAIESHTDPSDGRLVIHTKFGYAKLTLQGRSI